MKRINLVSLCITVMIMCASVTFGQETTTQMPSHSPGVSPDEKKPAASVQNKWEFEITPYFWMAGLNGDVMVRGVPADVSMSFGDVWSDLKFGAQVHMEARKERWGFFLMLRT